MVEKSWEIERMFNKEIRDQKRTGRGAHNKVSRGEKANAKGFWRGLSKFDKPYTKNTKTETMNIHSQIVDINKFKSFNKDMQINLLIEWRKRYSNDKIKESLGLSFYQYQDLLKQLNIEKIEEEVYADLRLTQEQLKKAKEEVIPWHEFKLIPDYQKFELMLAYQDKRHLGLKNKELADMWGISAGSIGTYKNKWKKEYEEYVNEQPENNDDEEESNEESITVDKLEDELDLLQIKYSDNTPAEEEEDSGDNRVSGESSQNKSIENEVLKTKEEFTINISSITLGAELSEKLRSVSVLLESMRVYDVEIKIKEANKPNNVNNQQLLETITKLLKGDQS